MTMNVLDFTMAQMEFFLLMMVRISGLFIFTPFFGSQDIPRQAKAIIILILALVIFPAIWTPEAKTPIHIGDLTIAALSELSIGILIGFTANMIFLGVQFGGFLIGHGMGLAMANTLDPFSETQVSVISQVYFYLLLVIFIIIDGPDWLIASLVKSFQVIGPGMMAFTKPMVGLLAQQTASIFLVGFMFAAPIIGTLFIVHVLLGFVSKTMPQMNIFVIGLPAQLIVGTGLIILGIPIIADSFRNLFASATGVLDTLIRHMAVQA